VKSKKKPDRKVKAAPKKPRIAVLIADDHSVVREGLVSLIRRKPDMLVVAEASNGREAVDLGNSTISVTLSICECPSSTV
jgi:DNA-binding NarL/FixJ family response regulator